MADDLNLFFGEGSFADATLRAFGDDQQYETAAAYRLPPFSGMVTFDARLNPDAPGFRTCHSVELRGGRMLLFSQIHDAREIRAWRERP
jgi:hypothetical protein